MADVLSIQFSKMLPPEKKYNAIKPAIKSKNMFYDKSTAGMLFIAQGSYLNNCRVNKKKAINDFLLHCCF